MKILRTLGLLLLAAIAAAIALVWMQSRRTPSGAADYVALGSSFAAGADLGPLAAGSPLLCARSINGYPQQLSRMLNLPIVDMSCGGAETVHLLEGGQFFQGAQLRVVAAKTRLVTITIGGNDLGYAGDLSMLAARNTGSAFGWLVRHGWGGPRKDRDYARLHRELVAVIRTARRQAPDARIVLVTYPAVLPRRGTCTRLALSADEARMMRDVADRFAAISQSAARAGGALLVDMNTLGAAHHACSAEPWTYGWTNAGNAPFHPTLAGARATAEAVRQALGVEPQQVVHRLSESADGWLGL